MNQMPVPLTLRISERRSIVLATLGFVFLSAALHVLLGGSLRAPWAQKKPEQHVSIIQVQIYRTPTPAPVPTPTPRPQRTATPVRRGVAKPKAPSHVRAVAPPVRKGPALQASAAPAQTSPPASSETSVPVAVAASATPLDARGIIISARFIHRVEPIYPQLAIDRGAEGTVIVLVTIGPDGTPSNVRVAQSSGDASLDEAALQAAKASTFAPPEVDGQPATQTYRIIYTFYLD